VYSSSSWEKLVDERYDDDWCGWCEGGGGGWKLVDGDMMVVDVVDVKVEVKEEDLLMNDHVRFGTYHQLDFNHQF